MEPVCCVHRDCLRSVVLMCEDPEVACPYRDDTYACDCTLQGREIRAVSGDITGFFLMYLIVAARWPIGYQRHTVITHCLMPG